MTHVDVGTSKQTKARREQPTNPSELLIALRKRYKNDTKDELIERFCERVPEDTAINYQVTRDWAVLHYNRLVEPAKPQTERPKPQTKAEREAADKAEEPRIVERMMRSLSLSYVMPDGRLYGDWTGTEAGHLSKEQALVAKVVGDRVIRTVFKTDAALQKVIAGRK